ncbi:MAG TPA: Gfo/Idh/MocA family oxidoreductase [Chloroflexota bacterium]|nr:Gfo/Idh/MocA family oxidoreductase [Chloroflexota bacterium]
MSPQLTQPLYRAAIIGCGRIADTIEDEVHDAPGWQLLPFSHAGAYQRCPRTQLVAAADPNAERRRTFGQRRGVPEDHLYADYRELLERERPDVVSICVPTRAHEEVALAVAERAGMGPRAIFLEKPIAQSLAAADRMIAAFRQHNLAVAVNHTRTWDPHYTAIRRLIQEGAIGHPHSVMAHGREGALFGGTHLYDLIRSLLGRDPEWVAGELDPGRTFDPGARGVIAFPDGMRAYVNQSESDPTGFEVDVVGSDGRIRAGQTTYPELWQVDRSGKRPAWVRRTFPGIHDGRSAMLRAVENLLDAIETAAPILSSPTDARTDLEIAVAFHLSHQQNGARIPFPVTQLDYTVEDPWGRAPSA